jgi:hypothetical protein
MDSEFTGVFLTLQLTIDAAGVNRDAEALCHSFGQLRSGNLRLGGPELRHKLHGFAREFVAGSGTALLRQQASEASFLKGRLRLIERWGEKPKALAAWLTGCLSTST